MSIRYTSGNLLEAQADALVNTVNEIGVMGKGIALQFRETFPQSAKEYERRAKAGEVRVGRVLVTEGLGLLRPRWIIHFPTKKHWRHPSRLAWIHEGLRDLERVIRELEIQSIALPPLGCGNGGLDWALVKPEIERALGHLNVDVLVYEPTDAYFTTAKAAGVEQLTPARALMVGAIRRYAVLGMDCTYLEAHKLAWFVQRAAERLGLGRPLELSFVANQYGPYSDRLRHLLDALDGSFLHAERRLADERPLDGLWADQSHVPRVDAYFASGEGSRYAPVLQDVAELIEGFESPLGLEVLATVDWLLHHEGIRSDLSAVREALASWSAGPAAAERKLRIFDDRLLELSLERLTGHGAAAAHS